MDSKHAKSLTDCKTLVFVPTYNEKDNVENLCKGLLAQGTNADILFLDDNSPDGTGETIDRLSREHANVFTIHRTGKLGIGSAHQQGIKWAYEKGYDALVTMDCDFTHPPEYLPVILREAASSNADVVIGSRYMKSDSLPGWNMLRKTLTNVGHVMTRLLLGMSYDATGAFRLYRLDRIPRHLFDLVLSKGYSFFFESLYILFFNKHSIAEFPISLPARTYGHSKMDFSEVRKSVKLLFYTFLTSKFNPERYLAVSPLPESVIDSRLYDPQGWEDYWGAKDKTGGALYDAVAAIYRKFIIKPALNHFIRKTFARGAKVVHAGCGGGQVDREVVDYLDVSALDISVNALKFYRSSNGENSKVIHASIFEMPLADNSLDGVYNLGVMEHFSEEDIQKILAEFKRVLKPGGRAVIFWPPEFGISVMFFKFLKSLIGFFSKKSDVKFHPDEISRIQSKDHALAIFRKAKFDVVDYYFGPRDFFTQCAIVAEKPKADSVSPQADVREPLVANA